MFIRLSMVLALFAAASILTVFFDGSAHAADYGGGSIQGYAADSAIGTGTIVELTGKDADRVTIASKEHAKSVFGIVVDPRQMPVRLSNGDKQNETFVAASGTYTALVGTEGGTIQPGDYVALSSIDGVLMKASTDDGLVFGRAAAQFDGSGMLLGTTTLKDTAGKTSKSVKLGSVPVTIDIRKNPNQKSTKANVPEVLERVGQAIAEKEVSPVRIYLSTAIAVVSLIAAIGVLYAGVRSGMISIGRNPMSKRSIFRGLFGVVLTSLLILIVGLFAVYLLLKL